MDMRSKEMKRLILVSIAGILFGIFIIIVGLQWLSYSKGEDFTPVYLGYLVLGSIIIIITLLHFYKSITDLKKGIPIEDERSRRIFFKSAALAFFITLFMRIIIIAI